jgi:hypothetical protein
MQSQFVLIGSAALARSLPSNSLSPTINPRDYDIITDATGGGYLALNADSKKGRLLTFTDYNNSKTSKVVDLKLSNDNKVVQQIYDDAQQQSGWKKEKFTLSSQTQIECIIPPLEYLHALYRSHMHRIPSLFVDQRSNIEVWLRWMENYSVARLYDYKSLDESLKLNPVVSRIFNLQFNYVTELLGDTFSMDKTDIEFFSDNVERLLPHDEVHKAVARISRRVDEPLFTKFLVSPGSAKMSETLFLKADRNEQINTIKEEIMVLWLERIMLPEVMESDGKPLESEAFMEVSDKGGALRDLMVHFVTNLCDNGHSWLRQWCIDHWTLFSDLNDYPIEQLVTFANSFNPDLRLYGAQPQEQKIVTPVDMLAYYKNIATKKEFKESLQELSDLLKKRLGKYGEHEYATFPCLSKELNDPTVQTFIKGVFVHSGTKEIKPLHPYTSRTTTKKIGPIVKNLTLRLNTQTPLSLLNLIKKAVLPEVSQTSVATPVNSSILADTKEHEYLFFYNEENEDGDSDVEIFIIYDLTDGIGIYYDFEACYMQMKHDRRPNVDEVPVVWAHQIRDKKQNNTLVNQDSVNQEDGSDSSSSSSDREFPYLEDPKNLQPSGVPKGGQASGPTCDQTVASDTPFLEQVLENLFVMEIKYDGDARCKFAIHFLEKDTCLSDRYNDESCDNDESLVVEKNSTYFSDTRKSTYYVSTCSESFPAERDLTYMNHYGNNDSKFEKFLESLARLYMKLEKDEESE